ncbi:conserved hypothetical protein [delta proteobacterium NaphS2]|nr:conserved hypothetical protein [delta proteobacterium NaphS2]
MAFAASNVLLDLLETRLDFPPGPIILDNLLGFANLKLTP